MAKRNFKTHNDGIHVGGSLVGYINATYADIKSVFGKPGPSDGYKGDAEWEIQFKDGTTATIYNWKDGKNYCGKNGLAKSKITNWHIGGESTTAVTAVKEELISRGIKVTSQFF